MHFEHGSFVTAAWLAAISFANPVHYDDRPSRIPPHEASALGGIIEDKPEQHPEGHLGTYSHWHSPEYPLIYKVPLPIPPVKKPKLDPSVLPADLPRPEANAVGGLRRDLPRPHAHRPRGTEIVVRVMNSAELQTSVHLHGSPSRAPFDGWANDVSWPGQYKDYYYPNYESARMIWYHDHASGVTAENGYFGQAAAYIITDPAEDVLGLPSGYGEYDVPLVLTSKYYNKDGTLPSIRNERLSVWGDVIQVNGQPWPYMDVRPRRYRFRILNAAVSRNWALYLTRSGNDKKLPFRVIASDAGLFTHPVTIKDGVLYISNAERYEIIVDFADYAGESLELRNLDHAGGIGVDDDFPETGKVMRFNVASKKTEDPSTVPAKLKEHVSFPPTSSENRPIDHHFRFHMSRDDWLINGVAFSDVAHRVLAKVPQGTIEVWELENASPDWTHPIHVHLVDFRVLSRFTNAHGGDNDHGQKNDNAGSTTEGYARGRTSPRTEGPTANRGVEPYEAAGLKDVVWLGRGETVRVEAHYRPWSGVYLFHCHNLVHEDHDMMAAFNVTAALRDLGYDETTDFSDPMDPRWRARPFDRGDFEARKGIFGEEAIRDKVERLARLRPYSDLDEVDAALADYWDMHEGP
ncbi:multicopper oxidase [Apiospora marii]|uniref:Multicopper oxidase n=1 Tax=Apiospora marii TaxID=335849 RepID=A0ABR1R4G5_9PEZI